uniref:Apolipoprotein C-II n=1 Tax=Scophthalmus maximus TaxID=52904 RepID=A0A8D3DUX6_SCOMX
VSLVSLRLVFLSIKGCVETKKKNTTTVIWPEAQEKVNELVGGVLMLASMYHDEYIQPLTSSYAQWASDVKSSAWEKIQTTLDEYMMIKATNATDQN